MFFRLWFLYLCKLTMVLIAAQVALNFVPRGLPWVMPTAVVLKWSLAAMGVIGTVATVPLVLLRCKIGCPRCGRPGEVAARTRLQPGVVCKECGFVYAQNFLTSFKLRTDREAEFESDESS